MKTNRFFVALVCVCLAACQAASPDLYADAARNRATADAAQEKARWQERLLTATAQAPIIEITQTAAALSVQGTQQVMNATATAQAWTATPQPTHTPSATPTTNFTATVAAAQAAAVGTQIANNTERDNLQLKREQSLNGFYAQVPVLLFIVLVGAFALGLLWLSRRERFRPVAVDARGNPIPVMDVVQGTITDIDRSPNYRGEMMESLFRQWLRQRLSLPALLPPVTSERQDATTQRDQMVDLATRGFPGQQNTRRQVAGPLLAASDNLQERFKILPQGGENLEILDGEIVKVLDEDWRAHERT